VATAVALQHSASVVLVHHHHVASEQLLSRHGTGFIVWSSAEDYLVLTANHVITLEEHEMNDEVEIVAVATTFPLHCFEAIHPVISRSFGLLTMMIRVR